MLSKCGVNNGDVIVLIMFMAPQVDRNGGKVTEDGYYGLLRLGL